MRLVAIALSVVAAVGSTACGQDFFVEASRTAVVRDDPDTSANRLLVLERGDQLNAVTDLQTNRFYNVFLPNGERGFVSSFVVRLNSGLAPNAPPVAIVPGVGGGLSAAERENAAFHFAIGKPGGYEEIIREGFTAGYDPKLKIAVWVQYRLTKERSEDNTFPRTNAFDEDAIVPPQARATLDDYAAVSSDYVRGHMAPAEDMRFSEGAEKDSNLLSNIAPQIGSSFNGSVWKTIENRVRRWVLIRDDLTIICGPVFDARNSVVPITRQPDTDRQQLYNVVGVNDVAVPSAFFKIVVDMRDPNNPDVLAFLVPHIATVPGPERSIETHLTSIDEIERLTGLDFLTNLPELVQEQIESVVAAQSW